MRLRLWLAVASAAVFTEQLDATWYHEHQRRVLLLAGVSREELRQSGSVGRKHHRAYRG